MSKSLKHYDSGTIFSMAVRSLDFLRSLHPAVVEAAQRELSMTPKDSTGPVAEPAPATPMAEPVTVQDVRMAAEAEMADAAANATVEAEIAAAEAMAEPLADQATEPTPAKANGSTPPAAPKRGRGRPKKGEQAEAPAEVVEPVQAAPAPAAKPSGPKAEALSDEEEATLRARLRAESARVQRLHGIGARTAILEKTCGGEVLMLDEVPVGALQATLAAFEAVA